MFSICCMDFYFCAVTINKIYFSQVNWYAKLLSPISATYWILYETRVAATTDKCRAINDSCRNIAVIATVDVDHCAVILVAFDCARCFVTSARVDSRSRFPRIYIAILANIQSRMGLTFIWKFLVEIIQSYILF